MGESRSRKIDRSKLPWFYRLILKVPGGDFLEHHTSGIFWAVVVPVFLILFVSLDLFLLLLFTFPTNVILAAATQTVLVLVFARVMVERSLNLMSSMVQNPIEWNVNDTVPEYLELLKKKEEKNNKELEQ